MGFEPFTGNIAWIAAMCEVLEMPGERKERWPYLRAALSSTRIEKDYRVRIPETLQPVLHVGDELLVEVDQAGRILLIPEKRILEILAKTAGMWRGRKDIPTDGAAYVQQVRQGHRLAEQRNQANEDR